MLLTGCEPSGEAPALEGAAPGASAAEKKANPPAGASAAATAAPEGAAPAQAVANQQFTPPFPERLDLFEPPKRAQGAIRRQDESGDTVELKGFINVNGQRVVLSIGGVIAALAEGEEKYGVQVKSIAPPSVVLQRGPSRWTATLQ
jgi:hypothetical protein